jgi:hypothetical protein
MAPQSTTTPTLRIRYPVGFSLSESHRQVPREHALLKDLLTTSDLSARDITDLVDLAAGLEPGARRSARGELAGEMVVLYLTQASPEARRTYGAAASLLGAGFVTLGPDEYLQGRGASVTGVARAVSLSASVVVACTDDVGLRQLADAATVPVTDGRNRGDDPCSRLADALARHHRCPSLDRPRVVEVDIDSVGIDGAGAYPLPAHITGRGQRPRVVDVTDLAADAAAAAPQGTGPARLGRSGTGVADLTWITRITDLTGTGALSGPIGGRRVLYGPSGTAVVAAVERRTAPPSTGSATPTTSATARTPVAASAAASVAAVAVSPEPAPICTCQPAARRAEHRVHAAAAILLALHRRQLTGAGAGA